MKSKSKLIGKKAYIKNSVDQWAGFWGYIINFDGDVYHISGGAIGDSAPIFDRNEFVIRKEKK
jgi:hypothetical protein